MLRCVLSSDSGCEHDGDRVLELGDNRDSPFNGEATRHYHRCLRPPALHSLCYSMERGSSAVECRTRNQVSPGSNPSLLPFRRLGIFVLSIDAPVDSAV